MTVKTIAVLLALLVGVAAPGPSAAADRCAALSRELASLGTGGGGVSTARYAVSADRQREALRRAEANASAAGCGGVFAPPGCAGLLGTIARMRENLASLESMARRGGGSGGARAKEVRGQMRDLGCGASRTEVATAPARKAAPPVTVAQVPRPGAPRSTRPIDLSLFSRGGAYRTLCVRLCDGYYFPISWATRPSGFSTDDFVCQQRCPGTETRLFAHPTGTESETATSVIGERWDALPAAFRYRRERVAGCGCRGMGTEGAGAGTPILRELKLPPLGAPEPPAAAEPATPVSFETSRFDVSLDLRAEQVGVRTVLPPPVPGR